MKTFWAHNNDLHNDKYGEEWSRIYLADKVDAILAIAKDALKEINKLGVWTDKERRMHNLAEKALAQIEAMEK